MCSSFSNYSMFNNQHLFCLGVGGGGGAEGFTWSFYSSNTFDFEKSQQKHGENRKFHKSFVKSHTMFADLRKNMTLKPKSRTTTNKKNQTI